MVLKNNLNFKNKESTYKDFFDINESLYLHYPYRNGFTFKLFDNELKESQLLRIDLANNIGNRRILSTEKILYKDLSDNKMNITGINIYENGILKEVSGYVPAYTGGRKAYPVKKEVCGKLRCIYKIPGSRKEHLKYKGQLITVTDYKRLYKLRKA